MSILFMVGSGEEDPEVVDALLDLEATPRKPVYALADPEPLVLYQCTYDHLGKSRVFSVSFLYNFFCVCVCFFLLLV